MGDRIADRCVQLFRLLLVGTLGERWKLSQVRRRPLQPPLYDEHRTRKLELQTEALAFAEKVAYAPDYNQHCTPSTLRLGQIH